MSNSSKTMIFLKKKINKICFAYLLLLLAAPLSSAPAAERKERKKSRDIRKKKKQEKNTPIFFCVMGGAIFITGLLLYRFSQKNTSNSIINEEMEKLHKEANTFFKANNRSISKYEKFKKSYLSYLSYPIYLDGSRLTFNKPVISASGMNVDKETFYVTYRNQDAILKIMKNKEYEEAQKASNHSIGPHIIKVIKFKADSSWFVIMEKLNPIGDLFAIEKKDSMQNIINAFSRLATAQEKNIYWEYIAPQSIMQKEKNIYTIKFNCEKRGTAFFYSSFEKDEAEFNENCYAKNSLARVIIHYRFLDKLNLFVTELKSLYQENSDVKIEAYLLSKGDKKLLYRISSDFLWGNNRLLDGLPLSFLKDNANIITQLIIGRENLPGLLGNVKKEINLCEIQKIPSLSLTDDEKKSFDILNNYHVESGLHEEIIKMKDNPSIKELIKKRNIDSLPEIPFCYKINDEKKSYLAMWLNGLAVQLTPFDKYLLKLAEWDSGGDKKSLASDIKSLKRLAKTES